MGAAGQRPVVPVRSRLGQDQAEAGTDHDPGRVRNRDGHARTCEEPPDFKVETREVRKVRVGVQKPTAEPEGTVYGGCEEAAAAGEERVQGN